MGGLGHLVVHEQTFNGGGRDSIHVQRRLSLTGTRCQAALYSVITNSVHFAPASPEIPDAFIGTSL